MPDPLLNLFKYLLVILVWLFFLRVLRAVWVEARPERSSIVVASQQQPPPMAKNSGSRKSSSRRPSGVPVQPRLKVVSGTAILPGTEVVVDGSLTIGRGQGCSVPMVKDTFASSVHARVYLKSDELFVEDLDSTNGTFVNGKKVSGPETLAAGDRLQIGQTIFEVSL